MARPVNADAAATRERILTQAAALFADRGAGAVSIRDISKAANVSLAMVHHYFGSKDDLHKATIDAMYEELAEVSAELQKALAVSGDKKAMIQKAIEVCFDFARDHQLASRMVMRTVVETGQLPPERRERALIPFLAGIEVMLGDSGLDRHELRLRAQSIVFLVVRYALTTIEEMAVIAGLPAPGDDLKKVSRVLRAVKEHLAGLAVSALVPEEEKSWKQRSSSKPNASPRSKRRRSPPASSSNR